MKKILILDPFLSQSIAISKYIKKSKNFFVVGGVVVKNSINSFCNIYKLVYPFYYDVIIYLQSYDEININQYDFIIPTGAKSTYQILQKYEKLFYCNDISFHKENLICYDKIKMLNIVEDLGIPAPKTYINKEEISSFPIFYKEKFEKGGGIRGIANSVKEIPKKEGLIYQEYINSPETYGVGFLAKNGEIKTLHVHKEILSYPKEGGSAVLIEDFYDSTLEYYVRKIVSYLNYNGWGLAEFKYDNKGNKYYFMELNAKLWASIELMLANNPKFLEILLDLKYTPNKTKRILFINRFLEYNFFTILSNLNKINRDTKIIKEQSIVYQLIKTLFPNNIRNLAKNLLLKR